jgi:hypothetical protein
MVLLQDMTRAVLTQAIRVYLEEAYGAAPLPPAVQARLEWGPGATLEELAAAEVFERTPDDLPIEQCDRVRLRLGNREYPHMKLGADRIPDSKEWVLAVDCHDRQLLTVVSESERAALEALLRRNNELKTRIERRWTEAGLPTFERYIRGRLAAADGA